MFTGASCIGMFGSRWDVAPHISAPPTSPHSTAQHHTAPPTAPHSTAQHYTAPHISAPPRATHSHRLASLCANDPDNNHHGDDGDDDEAMLFNINSIRSLYCEIKLQDWSFYMIHPAHSMSVLQSGLWNEIAEGPRAPRLTISDHITSIHLNHTFLREIECVLN